MPEEKIAVNEYEMDFSHVPLKPTGAKEVRELEIALIIGTIFRSDVIKEIMEPRDFTTWLDSLAVAAGALAREKAGYPISRIAEELGRTETTIRNHLQGKTKAGQLVRETYEMMARGKLKLALPIQAASVEEVKKLEEKVDMLRNTLLEVKKKLEEASSLVDKALGEQ